MKWKLVIRKKATALLVASAVLAVAGTALAYGGGGATGKFAASFDARAVADPTITSCPGLGREGQKLEGRYQGTMTVDGEEFAFNFTTLEVLLDGATGVGAAEGTWQLSAPPSESDPPTEANPPTEVVARGELVATVRADDQDLLLQGLVIGSVSSPDPDMPAQRLVGSFTASLGDGATFPHLKGTVGDPSVGDPTVGDPSVGDPTGLAVVMPAKAC